MQCEHTRPIEMDSTQNHLGQRWTRDLVQIRQYSMARYLVLVRDKNDIKFKINNNF